MTVALLPGRAAAQALSGSYTGDSTDNRAITGLGFQPDVVIVKTDDSKVGVIRTSTMAGDLSKPMTGATGLTADLIQSLNADGFTVGTDDRVNKSGITVYWVAFKAAAGLLRVRTYTGDGLATKTVTGVGFSPELVIVLGDVAKEATFRTSASTTTFEFDNSSNAAWFSSLNADGFTVGTDDRVNKTSTTYHYLAFNQSAGRFAVGSYAGNGVDGRSVTGVGLAPEYLILREAAQKVVQRTESMGTGADTAGYFSANPNATNRIQGLEADGFQVGDNNEANGSGNTYVYLAWVLQPAIIVSPQSGLTTTEAGGTATFTVVLDTAPTANVTIGLSSSDTTEGTVSPSSLTFTTGNWSTPQTVTVTGVDDAAKDGDIAYSVVTAAATSSDTSYSGLNASDVAVTTTDDEVAQTVQSGTATIGGGSTTTTATITAVAMSRAFLVFSTTLNDSNPLNTEVRGEITDPTTVTFTRFGTTGAVTIKWSVVEYASGVTVQRGTTASLTSTTNSIPIASVNTAKAFPIISYSQDGTTHAGNDFYKAKLTSSTNLDVSVAVAGTAIVSWQVVEFTNATVQSGDVSFLTTDASKTATVTSVNTSKSWLVFTHTSDDGTTTNIGQKLVRGQMTNATTLTFDRVSTGQAINLTWYLVEFTDNHVVQKGSQAFTTSETQKDVTIASVATANSFAVGGSLIAGGPLRLHGRRQPGRWLDDARADVVDQPAHHARPDGQRTADMGWFVVTIPTPGITVTPTSGLTTTEAGGTATFTVVLTSPADGQRGDRAEFERHDGRNGFAGVADLHVGQLEHAADGDGDRSR